jgi:hypothetical protein
MSAVQVDVWWIIDEDGAPFPEIQIMRVDLWWVDLRCFPHHQDFFR